MNDEQTELGLGAYVAAFLALLALTGVTFGLSFVPLGALELPVAIAIALAKASLVALYFMHLVEQPPSHRIAALTALALAAILIVLAAADVLTRA